jgi:hypothetical protein
MPPALLPSGYASLAQPFPGPRILLVRPESQRPFPLETAIARAPLRILCSPSKRISYALCVRFTIKAPTERILVVKPDVIACGHPLEVPWVVVQAVAILVVAMGLRLVLVDTIPDVPLIR